MTILLKSRQFAGALMAGILLLAALYFVALAAAGLRRGYSWRDMDWNKDGWTGVGEVLQAADIADDRSLRTADAVSSTFA
jgi:hypothetical protein